MGRRVDENTPRRIISLHWGDKSTGKTDTALSFPEPIYFGNFNFGVDPLLLGPRYKGKDVDIEDFGVSNPGDHEEQRQVLRNFHDWWLTSLDAANKARGTVVVDTTSELWEMIRNVMLEDAKRERFKKQSKVGDFDKLKDTRLDYGPVNAYMRQLMLRAQHFPNVNVALLASCKGKYNEMGQELAERLYNGFGALPSITDVTLHHYQQPAKTFKALIERCRHNMENEGLEIANPGYAMIKAFVYGE